MNSASPSFRIPRALLSLLGGMTLLASAGRAADGTWTSATTGGNWSDTANWNSGTVANGTGASATFSTNTSGNSAKGVTLDTAVTLGTLYLLQMGSGAAGYGGWVISGGELTLASGTANAPVIQTTGSNSSHTISAVIHGSQGFNKTGTGNLTLSGNNDYTGLTTLGVGNVYLTSNNGLGASGTGNETLLDQSGNNFPQLHLASNITSAENFILSARVSSATAGSTVGSTFLFNDSGDTTLSGAISLARSSGSANGQNNVDAFGVQASAGTLTLSGNIQGTLNAATITGVQATGTYANPNVLRLKAASGAALNISGTISDGTIGTGGISVQTTADSAGLIRISGANTYTGSTILSSGTVLINNTSGSGTGTGSISVASGTTFGGTGSVAPSGANSITFASGSTVAPGDLDSAGAAVAEGKSLTFALGNTTGSATFANGASIAINLNVNAATVAESLAFTGLSAGLARVHFNDNVVNFSVTGGLLADGVYTLASFDAANAYDGRLVLGTGLEAYSDARLILNANTIQLAIGSAIPEPASCGLLAGLAMLGLGCLRRRRT